MKVKNFKQLNDYLAKFRKGFYSSHKEAIEELTTVALELTKAKNAEITKNVNKTASYLHSIVKSTKNSKEVAPVFEQALTQFKQLKTSLPMYEFQENITKMGEIKSKEDIDKESMKAMMKNMIDSMNKIQGDQNALYKDLINDCYTLKDYETVYNLLETNLLS